MRKERETKKNRKSSGWRGRDEDIMEENG